MPTVKEVDLTSCTIEAIDSTHHSLFIFQLTSSKEQLSLLFATKVKSEYIRWRTIFGQWICGDRRGYNSLSVCLLSFPTVDSNIQLLPYPCWFSVGNFATRPKRWAMKPRSIYLTCIIKLWERSLKKWKMASKITYRWRSFTSQMKGQWDFQLHTFPPHASNACGIAARKTELLVTNLKGRRERSRR